MTRAILGAVCLLMAWTVAVTGEEPYEVAFPSCGVVEKSNTSHQFGSYNWLEYIVETQGVVDPCGQWMVAVEGRVVHVDNSLQFRHGVMNASARQQVMVPYYGRWQTNGRHWATFAWLPMWWLVGQTVSHAEVIERFEPAPPEAPDEGCSDCSDDAGSDDDWSPIIIDTGRNGYKLTSVEKGVQFDLDADGIPEQVSWTTADGDEAFLAMDRNGNGQIDSGAELFGNYTPAYPGTRATTPNGFEALAFLESPHYGESRTNNVIDAQDSAFSRLLLWRDRNHNGISEPDELQSVSSAGVTAIHTEYKNRKRVDKHGNEFRQRGTIIWYDGADFCFDVWLRGRR